MSYESKFNREEIEYNRALVNKRKRKSQTKRLRRREVNRIKRNKNAETE